MDTAVGDAPLRGFTIAVTAQRRSSELATMLSSRGAEVLVAHAIKLVPRPCTEVLRELTERCIDNPPDVLVATSSYAVTTWLAAADSWDMGDRLRSVLRECRILARGPKTSGALWAEGIAHREPVPGGSTRDILAQLLIEGIRGARLTLLPSGASSTELTAVLADAGAEVTVIELYDWVQDDAAGLERIVRRAIQRKVDAVVFTSAPAVKAFLGPHGEEGADSYTQRSALVAALRSDVMACCIGAETARPLTALGLNPVQPPSPSLGALVRTIAESLPATRCSTFSAGGHDIEVRGRDVRVDGAAVELAPAPLAVLRSLASKPGHVVARHDLRNLDSGGLAADDHAVEVAVARLRHALGHNRIIETVVKRGYRLAVDV